MIAIVQEITWGCSEKELQEIAAIYSAVTGKVAGLEWLENCINSHIVFKIENNAGFQGIIVAKTLEESEGGTTVGFEIITQMKEKMALVIKKVVANLLEDEGMGAEKLVIETTDKLIMASAAKCGFVSCDGSDMASVKSSLVLTREKYLADKRIHTSHKDGLTRTAKTNTTAARKPRSLSPKPIPALAIGKENQTKILELLLKHPSGIFQNLICIMTGIDKRVVSPVIRKAQEIGLIEREFYKGTYRVIPDIEKIRQKLSTGVVKMQSQPILTG